MRRGAVLLAGLLLLVGCGAQGPDAPAPSGGPGAPVTSQAPGSSASGQPPGPVASEPPVDTPSVVASGEELQVEPPVPIEQGVEASGLNVQIVELTAINTQARIPGEVSGPGLAVQLELTNESGEPIEIDSLVVTVYDSTEAPAGLISSDSDMPRGELAPGESLNATFRYTIAVELRQPVTIEVSLPNHPSLLTFRGDAPTE